jgi:CBS domain-containing protein
VIDMLTVSDVMTQPALSVTAATPLREVAELLLDTRISGVPVVDDTGAVVGVVSEADFLVKEQGRDALPHRPLARIRGESRASRAQLVKLTATTAGEAMTSPAVTVGSGCRISQAAEIMTSKGVNRLPVVDDGRLVGIVSRADLVRAYVRSDDQLARTVRDEVLLRILWLDPSTFAVDVEKGVLSISGRVERRSTAEMVERAVAMVPGLVDVRCDVTWSMDDSDIRPTTLDPVFPFSPH